jgi:hypothetical protein
MEQVYTHAIWKFGKANIQVGILYPKAHLYSKWKIRLFGCLKRNLFLYTTSQFPTHHHLVLRSRIVELYFHPWESPWCSAQLIIHRDNFIFYKHTFWGNHPLNTVQQFHANQNKLNQTGKKHLCFIKSSPEIWWYGTHHKLNFCYMYEIQKGWLCDSCEILEKPNLPKKN